MFKIIKVNLKNNHNIKLNINKIKKIKVKVVRQHAINVVLDSEKQVSHIHIFKIEIKQIHIINVNIDVASNTTKIKTGENNLNNKFKVVIRNQPLYRSDKDALKVVISVHKMKCEVSYILNIEPHKLKVLVNNEKTITVQINNIISDKNSLTINDLSSIKTNLITSFNINSPVRDKTYYNSCLTISPLKFYETGITSDSRYVVGFKDKLVKAINSTIQDLSKYYTRFNLSTRRLDIVILNKSSYIYSINPTVNIKIKDWMDVTRAYGTWGELLDVVEKWRDLLRNVPIKEWEDLRTIHGTWGDVLECYDRWIDINPDSEDMMIIEDKARYISGIKNTILSCHNNTAISYMMFNQIKEGMGYGIDGYQYYRYRSLLSVVLKILKIDTWEDLTTKYNRWYDVLYTYERWQDLIDPELLNGLPITSEYTYYSDIIRNLLGLITRMTLNSPTGDTMGETVTARAKINDIYNASNTLNIDIKYNPIMSWEDLLNRSETWGSVNAKYQTWDSIAKYAIKRRLYIEDRYSYRMSGGRLYVYTETSFRDIATMPSDISEKWLSYMMINNYSSIRGRLANSYAIGGSFRNTYSYLSTVNVNIEKIIRPTWQFIIDEYATWDNVYYRLNTWEDLYTIK